VEVTEELDLDVEARHLHHLESVIYGRVQQSARTVPLAIEVAAKLTAPVVAKDDTVWVEHGHNSEDEILTERQCYGRRQHFEQPIQHVVGLAFARVHAASQNYCPLQVVVFQKA
jgi:hypothetical protein